MSQVCVIPARRASKRVPEKVLRQVAGRTLLDLAIASARDSGAFDLVVLSTEDPELAEIGRAAGLAVHERPRELNADDTGAGEITLAAADFAARELGGEVTEATCLAPVYPLRSAEHVARALAEFRRMGADFLMSVSPTDPHDFHWALRRDGEWAEMWFGDRFLADRSQLPAVMSPNGAIKAARVETLRQRGFFFGPRLLPFELTRAEGLYIGEELDLELAEFLVTRQRASVSG